MVLLAAVRKWPGLDCGRYQLFLACVANAGTANKRNSRNKRRHRNRTLCARSGTPKMETPLRSINA